jgi:site-specific recombinase XerD
LKVSECDWEAKRQRVKLNVKRSNEFNQILDQLEQKMNDIYYSGKVEGKLIDNDYILQALRKETKKDAKPLFFDEWAKYLEIHKNKLKKGTIKSMWTSYNHMRKFCGNKKIRFEDITPELLSKYSDFLLNMGNVNNTVHGNIKRLRIFYNYAKKIGLHNSDGCKFNLPEKVGRIKFLDWEEIKLLLAYKPISDFEQKVIDNFLFCCYTGLRFSDCNSLKKDSIKEHKFEGELGVFSRNSCSPNKD